MCPRCEILARLGFGAMRIHLIELAHRRGHDVLAPRRHPEAWTWTP